MTSPKDRQRLADEKARLAADRANQDAFNRLALENPDRTVVGNGTLAEAMEFLQPGGRRGRVRSIDPVDFYRLRAEAVIDLKLLQNGREPTRPQIADRLGIGVHTLYDMENRDPAYVPMKITLKP